MKALSTALLLFAVFVIFTAEAGNHNRRHGSHVRNEEASDDAVVQELPKPEDIHSFDVPEVFTHGADEHDNNEDDRDRQHRGSHHRRHKH